MRPYPNRQRALNQLARHAAKPAAPGWRGPLLRFDFGITPEKLAAIGSRLGEGMPILLRPPR